MFTIYQKNQGPPVKLEEINDCHAPAGSPKGGQFCSRRGARTQPDALATGKSAGHRMGLWLRAHHNLPPILKNEMEWRKQNFPESLKKAGGKLKQETPEFAPEAHQLQIAKSTLNMPTPMANVMGGPNKAEAQRIVDKAAGRKRLIPDAPALSTPRPINGSIISGGDENVVTVPYGREGKLKTVANIKKYILSGRDLTVHGLGVGTASITDFAPGTTLFFRYKNMTQIGSLKIPNQTVPWDGTAGPKATRTPKSLPEKRVAMAAKREGFAKQAAAMSGVKLEQEYQQIVRGAGGHPDRKDAIAYEWRKRHRLT